MDLTSSSYPHFPQYEIKPSIAIRELMEAGVPLEHITMTSDGNGSLPDYDESGNLIQLEMGLPSSVFREIREAVLQDGLPLDTAIAVGTKNPAEVLRLNRKGVVAPGKDADIVILSENLEITAVIAMGNLVMRGGSLIRKGAYE